MIPARPGPAFRRWFTRQARRRLRRRFGHVRVQGLHHLEAALRAGPVLAVSNHCSWWDPLVVLVLAEHCGADGRAMMDARNLRRLPFFRLLGAFGVDLDDRADGALALRSAARHLSAPGRLLWIFPQGRERPEDPRPLGFRPGSAMVARLARASVTIPVALRYVFAGSERPELLVAIGPPVPVDRDVQTQRRRQEEAVEAQLVELRAVLAEDDLDRMSTLLRAPPDRLGALAEAILARLSGWWLARADRRARYEAAVPATRSGDSTAPG